MTTYTNTQVSDILNVERQTVLAWAKLFTQYLSPEANPGNGITHAYTDLDVRKLALIQEMRARRRPKHEIEAALLNGEVGNPVDDVMALELIGKETPRHLKKRVEVLKAELEHLKAENLRLHNQVDVQQAFYDRQIETRDEQIKQLQKQIWRLEEKIG
jgi:DNA-binding transcriptional MerR regulator